MKKTPERKHIFTFDHNVGFNKKYTTIALYAALVIAFGVVCVYFLLNNDKYAVVFSTVKGIVFPIFTGMVLAYILNPFLKLFEEKVFISSARRQLNKCRRKLFKSRLAYDQLRSDSDADAKALENACKNLADAKAALDSARAAVKAEEDKRIEALLQKNARKRKKPAFRKTPSAVRAHPYRGVSLLCTYLVFFAIMILILWIIIPQCIESVSGLVVKLHGIVNTIPQKIEYLIAHNELAQSVYRYISEFISSDVDLKTTIMNTLTSAFSDVSTSLTQIVTVLPAYIYSALSSVTNIILAIFFSIYFLSSKETLARQAHKVGKALLSDRLYKGTCHVISEIDRKFGKFIEGKILDSTIIAIFALIALWLFKTPYYQMLALIIGITNIIPFFGPIIGGVIGGVLVLITDPTKLIPFIIIVLVIQQLDGNIIGPLILGDSLGLQPIWIMIAIVIMSSLFGFFGMLFGVPLFAVIFTLISEAVEKRLKKQQRNAEALDSPPLSDDHED